MITVLAHAVGVVATLWMPTN